MKKQIINYVFVLLIFYTQINMLFAQDTIVLSDNQSYYEVDKDVFFFEDKEKNTTLADIIKPDFLNQFNISPSGKLNFGYSYAAFWLKMSIRNESATKKKWLLEIDYPLLDKIEFWYQNKEGIWKKKDFGDLYPFYEREIVYRNFVIPLDFESKDIQTFYIRVDTQSASQIPLFIHEEEDFYAEKLIGQLVYGVFFGILITMLLYNLLIYISLRDKNYLLYVFAIFSNIILYSSLSGYSFQFIFYNSPYWANQIVLIGLSFTSIGINLFALSFLETKKYATWIYYIQISLIILSGFLFVFSFNLPYLLMGRFGIVVAIITAMLTLLASFWCWAKGNRASRFFILAFTAYLLGSILVMLRNIGLLPVNFLTSHSIEIGNALEVILLSLALADKYRIFKADKERIQEENLKIQKEANENLEGKVAKRTLELKEINEELNSTLQLSNIQKIEIQEKNQDIMDSISYAQLIQRSILQVDSRIKDILKNYFILFRPKDVVSGDFYRFILQEDKIIVAAIDCTGHGVPGAMMSMVGNSLLIQIVEQKGITEPDKILNELHNGIRGLLQQKDTDNKDGMDAVICTIYLKEHKVEFAGARNSLVYIQEKMNGSNELLIELKTIKGDIMSVGGEQLEEERVFSKHTFYARNESVNESADKDNILNTTIYLFSDGYKDQFGGQGRKKFMIGRLRTLLLDIHRKPLKAQKKLLDDTMKEWMGEEKQVDDILIIGIKL